MVMHKGQQAFDTYECKICYCEKCIRNIGLVESNAVSNGFFCFYENICLSRFSLPEKQIKRTHFVLISMQIKTYLTKADCGIF